MRSVAGVTAVALALAFPSLSWAYRDAEVRDAAAAAGFAPIADRVASVALPTVLLGRTILERAPRERGSSRLGGNPDLPTGVAWPRCGKGAQTFLAQIRLSDLPGDTQPLRAHGGVLLFFTHVRFESATFRDYGLWAGRCTRVVHAPEGVELVRTRPPRGAAVLPLRSAELRFRMRADVPDTGMHLERLAAPLTDIRLRDDQLEPWWDLRETLHRRSWSLGHRMLGYVETPNGETSCWERTQRRRGAWRHLFTMDADWRVGFDVADGGRLQVAIPPADLRNGRFGRACGSFDSN